jgi:hypothetical protein
LNLLLKCNRIRYRGTGTRILPGIKLPRELLVAVPVRTGTGTFIDLSIINFRSSDILL